MTQKRIYKVTHNDTVRLVRATNVAQARNHAARDIIGVKVASQEDLLAYLTAVPPVAVEEAGAEPAGEPADPPGNVPYAPVREAA